MTVQEYKSRLLSILNRVEPIVESVNRTDDIRQLKERINSLEILGSEDPDGNAIVTLDRIKDELSSKLSVILTDIQIAFVEAEEPDYSDSELFKKYLVELKAYKADLTSHDSETKKKVASLLRHSKSNLINELSSQAILFPTECLDTILSCPEVNQSNGAEWVVQQINEALNSLLDEVNVRLGATFDAVNEIIGSEIDALEETYTQSIQLNKHISDSFSDSMFGIARQALPSLGISSLGYGLASIIFGPTGALVTALTAGGLFLWKSQSSIAKQKKIAEIKQQLAPKMTLAMNELKTYVLERFDEFEEGVSESIKNVINLVDKEMQDCVDALKSCENERNKYNALQIKLNSNMNALETYIKQLEILNTNPFEQNLNNESN